MPCHAKRPLLQKINKNRSALKIKKKIFFFLKYLFSGSGKVVKPLRDPTSFNEYPEYANQICDLIEVVSQILSQYHNWFLANRNSVRHMWQRSQMARSFRPIDSTNFTNFTYASSPKLYSCPIRTFIPPSHFSSCFFPSVFLFPFFFWFFWF